MELRHLRYFVMVAEEGNISRAAERLHISQPAVSRQLRDLEEELGISLFERHAHGLHITEDGQTALAHARDLLRRARVMTDTFQQRGNKVRRTLRVGFIPTALHGFLAEGMRLFNEQHSKTCVHIREMSPREQESALIKGDIDLALLGSVLPESQKRFSTAVIIKTPMCIVLPNHHLLALRKSIDLSELEHEAFVSLHERHFPGRPALIADLSEKAGIVMDVAIKAEGLSEALGMVAGGAGVAVLPADVDQLPHPGVVFVKMRKPKVYLTSNAVWRKDETNPEVEILVKCLKKASGRS